MANKKSSYDLCRSAMEIQKILQRDNLDLAVWPNSEGAHCIFVIQKGDAPWHGARVSTIKQNVSFLTAVPKVNKC